MGRDVICRQIMAATGCDYTAAMRERDRRWGEREIDQYLTAMRKLPPRAETDPVLCVSCFEPGPCKCRRAA